MRCIQFQSAALLPLNSQPKQKQQLGTAQLLWLPTIDNNGPIKLASAAQRKHFLSLETKASMHNAINVLGVTAPAKSGDISALLQIGGVLLFAYLFSNFIVPDLISKYFEFDKVGEDSEDDDDPMYRR